MRIDIISCVPKLLESPLNHSIMLRAQQKGIVDVRVHDLRDFTNDKHKQVDDYAFGMQAGMVLKPEPLGTAITSLKEAIEYDEVIYVTPDGDMFDQKMANAFSLKRNIMIICGHYKGIDERIRQMYITKEVSIGEYVLSGGELAAAVITDAVVRLIPGVLSDETSALTDSFQDGLLAPPIYTRPANYEGHEVPPILRSGNEKEINDWEFQQSLERTKIKRPDLYKKYLGEA